MSAACATRAIARGARRERVCSTCITSRCGRLPSSSRPRSTPRCRRTRRCGSSPAPATTRTARATSVRPSAACCTRRCAPTWRSMATTSLSERTRPATRALSSSRAERLGAASRARCVGVPCVIGGAVWWRDGEVRCGQRRWTVGNSSVEPSVERKIRANGMKVESLCRAPREGSARVAPDVVCVPCGVRRAARDHSSHDLGFEIWL
mmetsp:Transcript_13163/g.34486  ORF Transcript_13163/g.34486 Transcript_13163/m.34486 type:complete len:207 (-) Transcript_13163:22-642(-)